MAHAKIKGESPCIFPKSDTCTLEKDADCVEVIRIILPKEKFDLAIGNFTDAKRKAMIERIEKLKAILKAGGMGNETFVCGKCGKTKSTLDRMVCPGCYGDFCDG
jgi:hypothetical protein